MIPVMIFDYLDADPSSFSIEQYVKYIDDYNYMSPNFNCGGETWFPTIIKSIESKDDIDSPTKNLRIEYDNDTQIYFWLLHLLSLSLIYLSNSIISQLFHL